MTCSALSLTCATHGLRFLVAVTVPGTGDSLCLSSNVVLSVSRYGSRARKAAPRPQSPSPRVTSEHASESRYPKT